jgi:cytidylate kinase
VLTGGQSGSGKQTIGAAKDDLALSVALDMTYDGHVSRYNARRMKQRGLKVGDFPRLKSYSDYFASTKRPNSTMNAYQMGALH